MNRAEFIERLFLMYPMTFTENNIPIWTDAYETVLNVNWDYEKLFKKMITKYLSTSTAPHPSWFLDFVNDVEPNKKTEALVHMDNLKKEQKEPISEEVQLLLDEATKKLAAGTNKRSRVLYGGVYD